MIKLLADENIPPAVVGFFEKEDSMLRKLMKEVLRYDCAHGYAHRDSYNLRGKHVKDDLYLSFEDTLTLADDDIDENWEIYKDRFLEGDLT